VGGQVGGWVGGWMDGCLNTLAVELVLTK
jgi:hypothetical protein